MSLLLSGDLRLRHQLPADAEADAYIAAVEQADGQALEPGVKFAIKNFVLCCKQDGIWDAIKACCILAGARTRLGALTPLVGTAPTSFNFVDGDYNRKTGLVGDGSTKYLDSNRNNNADPRDSKHVSTYVSSSSTGGSAYIGSGGATPGSTFLGRGTSSLAIRLNSGPANPSGSVISTGFYGLTRSDSTNVVARINSAGETIALASVNPLSETLFIFTRATDQRSNARLAFYSIGEALDLALLDARVTDLINAFGAAIP